MTRKGELAIDHRVPLEDLAPDTTHFFRARATDAEDRTFFSEVMSFRTALADDAPVEGPNVALLSAGTTVVEVSSNFANAANDQAWGVDHAFDGRMGSEWSSDGDGDDASVTIDFGRMRDVQRFGFRSRRMSNGTAIITSVRLIFDGETTMGPFETPDPDQRYVFDLGPFRARRVRLEAVTTTGGNTGAKEIEFYEAAE